MKTVMETVKGKGIEPTECEYTYPETLEEALETDGEEKVFTYYSQTRKIRWRDAERRRLGGGTVPKELLKQIRAIKDPDDLQKLVDLLGQLDTGLEEDED